MLENNIGTVMPKAIIGILIAFLIVTAVVFIAAHF